MLTPLREAFYFSRNQFKPLFIIGLVYAIPSFLLAQTGMLSISEETKPNIIAIFVGMCLNLLPFATAMLYIDGLSQGSPTTLTQAFTRGLNRLPWLIVLNALMGAIVGVGFLLLIVPGIFFAYKLLFAEMYLLLHNQSPMKAAKSSYVATTGLFGEIVPPILAWFASMIGTSLLLNNLLGDSPGVVADIFKQGVMLLFSLYGWALMYRLYQRFLEAQVTDSDDS